jgi:hypothetical protein
MSSDGAGAVGEAAPAAEPVNGAAAATAGSADWGTAEQAELADPWFAPGPKVDAAEATDTNVADADPGKGAVNTANAGPVGGHAADADAANTHPGGGHAGYADPANADPANGGAADGHAARQAEWFLRTGRAGLLPDSVTVGSDDDATAGPPADHGAPVAAAGSPPWAGEPTDALASAPPPWETGPWPGPGGLGGPGSGVPGHDHDAGGSAPNGSRAGSAADGAASGGAAVTAGSGRPYPGAAGGSLAAQGGRWPARTVVTAGLMPLVVPGLVLGLLSLRQPGSPAVRRASWLAIGASIAWAVIIILIVTGKSGGSAAGCASYPAAVHQAYERALSDLSDHAPASVQAADLDTAANRANVSAAAAGQIGVRTALFTMANDMAQARADIVAHRPVPGALRQHLAEDGAEPAGSCAS